MSDNTKAWALKETLSSKKAKKDVWFRFQTAIGPCTTTDPSERALFSSRESAMNTQAYAHPFCFFEPMEVEDGTVGDFGWNKPSEQPKPTRGRRSRR